MARARAAIRGRDQELAVLREALTAGGGRLIVLWGPSGIGRTTLLNETERALRAGGTRVLPVRLGAGADGPGDDAFALAPLVRALRDRFEEFQEAGTADSLGAVARLGEAAGQGTGGWSPSMVTALGNLFDRIGRQGRAAVLADDAQAVAAPAPMLTAARRAGCLVVATCEESAKYAPGIAELLAAADQVVTLGPLADDVAESLVRRAPGPRLDEAVPDVLRAALGPLFHNPGTLLGTLADLRASGRLTVFRDRLCLRAPAEPVELPADHHLLRRVADLGDPAARLLRAVAGWDGIGVDDLPLLAEVIEADLDDCGRVCDQLIDAEVLVADPAGRLSCRCPALAASAAGRSGGRYGVALHAAVAGRLLARHERHGDVDPVVLADHIARGGTAVALGADTVGRLLGLAEAAAPERPERAALWCAAALRRLPPGGPEYARTLTRLLDLVVGTGRYDLLREVPTRYARQDRPPGPPASTRLAAVLVALHSGEPPVGDAVRSLLDGSVTGHEPAGFARWWFGRPLTAGRAPGRADRAGIREAAPADWLELLGGALSGDPGACERARLGSGRAEPSRDLDRLRHAASVVDVATVARLVLGDRYRVPVGGVLGVYHRVVRDYAGADWPQAMSAVRELELSDSGDTLAHHAARLLAADMCAAGGEPGQAARWLADAAAVPPLAVLRAWVRIGLLGRTGEERGAARLALRVGRRLRRAGSHTGLHLLLTRAVQITAFTDDRDGAAELLEEVELLCRESGTDAAESLLLARGLVGRDVEQARLATDLTRERGDLPSLLASCLVVARFAEDPRPWLREAHGLATQCGAAALLECVRSVTRERGVPAPRARGQREAPAVTERRIIELLGESLTNRQIALRLRVSEKTVENHLTRLFARTGCRSRVELLRGRLT